MDLKVTLFQIRNKVLYVNGEKWWILTDQWERGQYKTLTGRVLYCSSRVSVWQCFGENRRICIRPCWMVTIFFKLPQFRFSTAKGHSKCRHERRNLAEPCPVLGTGGTEPWPGCPLHPYGLSGDGEMLSTHRLKYMRRRKPLSGAGLKYLFSGFTPPQTSNPPKKSGASHLGFAPAEAGSPGCIFWVRHGAAGGTNPRNGKRAYASALSHQTTRELAASYWRRMDVNWRQK